MNINDDIEPIYNGLLFENNGISVVKISDNVLREESIETLINDTLQKQTSIKTLINSTPQKQTSIKTLINETPNKQKLGNENKFTPTKNKEEIIIPLSENKYVVYEKNMIENKIKNTDKIIKTEDITEEIVLNKSMIGLIKFMMMLDFVENVYEIKRNIQNMEWGYYDDEIYPKIKILDDSNNNEIKTNLEQEYIESELYKKKDKMNNIHNFLLISVDEIYKLLFVYEIILQIVDKTKVLNKNVIHKRIEDIMCKSFRYNFFMFDSYLSYLLGYFEDNRKEEKPLSLNECKYYKKIQKISNKSIKKIWKNKNNGPAAAAKSGNTKKQYTDPMSKQLIFEQL